jgi:hypothetical protein
MCPASGQLHVQSGYFTHSYQLYTQTFLVQLIFGLRLTGVPSDITPWVHS